MDLICFLPPKKKGKKQQQRNSAIFPYDLPALDTSTAMSAKAISRIGAPTTSGV
jgi:hypothetical protein